MADSPTHTDDDLADALSASGRHTAATPDTADTPTQAITRPQPQDHLQPRATQARETDLDLEDFQATLPPLKDPNRLRVRDRNGILDLSLKMNALMRASEDGEDGDGSRADFDPEDPRTMELLTLLADFDDYALEHLALDPDQYVEWSSTGNAYEKLGNLLGLYGRAVGESASSSS